jgi:nitrate/TMAO reductase-like tetraheme cytochrome c subunit
MGIWGRGRKNSDEPKPPNEKRPGLLRRLWRKFRTTNWRDPVNRWKLVFFSLAGIVFLLGFSYTAVVATSTPTFCSSCHEMAPEYTTFEISSHSDISCVQCHVKPGLFNTLWHKVEAMEEVYYHFIATPPNPIRMEEPIGNENCLQCHSRNRLVTASGDLIVAHDKHVSKNIPCVICHRGVVHAKIVERGLNTQDKLTKWTQKTAPLLATSEFMKPNMGTCITCHSQVNQGKEPWKDPKFAVSEPPEEQKVLSKEEQHKQTTNLVLQAISKQQDGVKISMACKTCHRNIKTPDTHKQSDWAQAHGNTVFTDLYKCEQCHQESKWLKPTPREDIVKLLTKLPVKQDQQPPVTPRLVKDHARASSFCSTCHKDRPPGHLISDQWLTQHAVVAKSDEARKGCFVCHDYKKIEKSTAPTDVYCMYCHRTGLKEVEQSQQDQQELATKP